MTEFLVFWLVTCIASFGMEIANELRMFKDVSDAGYKIDTKKFSEFGKKINPDASKISLLSMLIPVFNMMQVLKRTIQYNKVRPMILDQLKVINCLDEMSEIEKEEYLKKPTGLNALIVPIKSEMRLKNAQSIKIDNENEKSEIYYEIGESFNDITILKVSGEASRLTVEEQKKKIIECWKEIVKSGIEEYGDVEKFIDALSNNSNIDLDNIDQNKKQEKVNSKTTYELNISAQKQSLESFKNELLGGEQSTPIYKNPTLSKKEKVTHYHMSLLFS